MQNLDYSDFEEKLQNDFPKLFSELPYCASFIDKGWYQIVYDLCSKIEELLESPEDAGVAQIKEKFGGLRFYYSCDREEIFNKVKKLVRDAERQSLKTCEVCGEPGEMRKDGWLKTKCDEHA